MKQHPRIWWDGSSFLYLLSDEKLASHEDRVPYFYRARTVEDVTKSEGPVQELVASHRCGCEGADTTYAQLEEAYEAKCAEVVRLGGRNADDKVERHQQVMLVLAAFRTAAHEFVYDSVQGAMMQATRALRVLGVTDEELDAAYKALSIVQNVNPRINFGIIPANADAPWEP